MYCEHKNVLLVPNTKESRSNHRTRSQVKRTLRLHSDTAFELGLTLGTFDSSQVAHLHRYRQRLVYHLARISIDDHKRRAQSLMAADELAEAVLQRRDIQWARDTPGNRHVVSRGARLQ